MVSPISSDALVGLPGIDHGFFTREGGVSNGLYDSLNIGLGSKDERDQVVRNRALISAHLGVSPEQLYIPYQVHSATAVFAETDFLDGAPKADAVIVSKPGVAIGVSTADCGPVLFADAENGVIGAAHAGWRGAFTGILEATLDGMEARGADRRTINAVLGPTISGKNYEVGPEFLARFLEADSENDRFFRPSDREGHVFFNLPDYIVARLRVAGIETAHHLNHCTYADEKRFFSYRRSVHRNEPDYGRLLAAIVLKP